MKKQFSSHEKAMVALEAIRGIQTMNEIVSAHSVHPTQVGVWKKHALDNLHSLFTGKLSVKRDERDELIERLYRIVGQRDIELDWLKKSLRKFDP